GEHTGRDQEDRADQHQHAAEDPLFGHAAFAQRAAPLAPDAQAFALAEPSAEERGADHHCERRPEADVAAHDQHQRQLEERHDREDRDQLPHQRARLVAASGAGFSSTIAFSVASLSSKSLRVASTSAAPSLASALAFNCEIGWCKSLFTIASSMRSSD